MKVPGNNNRIKWLQLLIALAVLLHVSGLWITIISPDGALYASIAKNMVVNNDFVSLTMEGRDWLDKPHFPFWVSAISFKLFGINTLAYKLPALLFVLMAAHYTFKYAKELYHRTEVGLWAALILLTAQHIIISSNDVRAEPYLTGMIIASVYHFYRSFGRRWLGHLLLASIFAACAVMTKGIFALIPIAAAIAGHLIITRQWKLIFDWRWLLAVLFTFLFITPELWCLYQQFDAHPEKVVFGRTNVSGLKFFFWDSQFGRFFNTGPIKKTNGDPFFFLHTTLWAFLPWGILFYAAVVQYVRKHVNKAQKAEWFNLCGAGFTFLIFSLTKFQLPHYLNIIFPFFAIITAQYIYHIESPKTIKLVRIVQGMVISLMVLLIIVLDYYFKPGDYSISFMLSSIICLLLLVFITANKSFARYKIYFQSAAVVFLVNIYFNMCYYPVLTTYQADSEAAFFINQQNKQGLPVVKVLNGYSYAIDFYTERPLYYYRPGETHKMPEKPYLVYGNTEVLDQLKDPQLQGKTIRTFQFYPITRLKGKFLKHHTREEVLGTSQLILIK